MKPITRYEHETLTFANEKRFRREHLDRLIALNNSAKNKYFSILPNGVKFKQYVGVIQMGEFAVQILPKADRNNDAATKNKWESVLTRMLALCGHVKINPYEEANLEPGNLNLLEFYFEQFVDEVQGLIRKGLIKKYRKTEGNLHALRGKLDFNKQIRHNLIHKEQFYTVHQIYDRDHVLHQVLAEALDIVVQFSTSMHVNDKCRRAQLNFPEVSPIVANRKLLDSLYTDRKSMGYKRALELARLIILNYSPNSVSGGEKMISILFDMNRLWEEYILVRLRQVKKEHLKVLGKRSRTFWGGNSLEPDIVLEYKEKTYIIDAKWKDPTGTTSIMDLRQMYAYGRYWKARKIMLLYPGNQESSGFQDFLNDEYHDTLDEHTGLPLSMRHTCKKGVVSVLHADNLGRVGLNEEIGNIILDLLELENE